MPTYQNIVTDPVYKAFLNEHPFVTDMLGALNQYGVNGLLAPGSNSTQKRQMRNDGDLSGHFTPTNHVETPYPQTEYDFSFSGPYAIYNWEVFFHSVSLIAGQLRENNKFAESIRWLNYVFDPSDTDAALLDLRFWQIKPFMVNVTQDSIQNMIRLLSASNLSPADMQLRVQYEAQITEWRRNPFDPHAIAAMRPRAYMLWTVMEYVTTLTDWGDYLFRQDTMESINEAINLYVIASEILGDRPKKVERPTPDSKSFDEIVGDLSSFSNVMVAFENQMTGLNLCNCGDGLYDVAEMTDSNSPCVPNSGVTTIPDLLFCVPDNPKLIEMWDKVEDRLFKIRHCMNIDGQRRSLALFAPPIDPALLVQAVAGGLSIGDALADLAAPLPYYRFNYVVQKANDFCNEVKGLGSQLLTLLEKKDAEELGLFRQVHEQNILKSVRALKQMAIEEAKQAYETLQSSKNLIQIRLEDYNAREYRNDREMTAMQLTRAADGFMYAEQGARLVAGILNLIPEINTVTQATVGVAAGVTAGVTINLPASGSKISNVISAGANSLTLVSSALRNKAAQSLTYASYDRREEEWNLQKKLAKEELFQVDRQLLGTQIRIAVAEKELENHDIQVEQSTAMYDWLKNKYTNGKLYSWMVGQVKIVYRQAFDLAYNMAKRAQVCLDYELGINSNIIQYGQWDSSKSGLLAGERLSLQIKRLENEYMRKNEREYELTKNISLALLNPLSLEELKVNGTCNIEIPDVLFNLDYPGHYFRRIKSVSISIPCIAGPHSSINATLSLSDHKYRITKEDLSAITTYDQMPKESIATSSAQNDSGVFELNFKDERYLPFEGRGAASKWTLELNDTTRQFDYTSISDVIIHMKYTAREAGSGSGLAIAMRGDIKNRLNAIEQGLGESKYHYALNLKHDLPNVWHEFKNPLSADAKITILKSRLPYFVQALLPNMDQLEVIVETTLASPPNTVYIEVNSVLLQLNNIKGAANANTKFYYGANTSGNLGSAALDTEITLAEDLGSLPKANIKDLVVIAKIGF